MMMSAAGAAAGASVEDASELFGGITEVYSLSAMRDKMQWGAVLRHHSSVLCNITSFLLHSIHHIGSRGHCRKIWRGPW